ncbi:hypothetical protein PRNP1_011940 [Phytophthora ramorum]
MGKKQTPGSTPHLHTFNLSTVVANQNETPWAADEHQRFLLALEQFGGGQCLSVGDAWRSIATAVGTRDTAQVVHHARLYFAQIQQVNAHKRQERQFMQSVDQRWTSEEDAAFESMLAAFSTSSVCYPWEVMASRLPGKSPVDLKERYQKLCYDVARIESGQHVTMHLGQFPRHPGLPLSTKAAAIGESGRVVPPEAPADLLAGLRRLWLLSPARTGDCHRSAHALFTKDQALEVLNGLLAAQQTDPQVVLETLAVELRLHPRALNVSAGVSFSARATNETAEPNLHLLATTGLTFGMLPSPLGSELGLPFEGAGITPRYLAGLGLLSPHLHWAKQRTRDGDTRCHRSLLEGSVKVTTGLLRLTFEVQNVQSYVLDSLLTL